MASVRFDRSTRLHDRAYLGLVQPEDGIIAVMAERAVHRRASHVRRRRSVISNAVPSRTISSANDDAIDAGPGLAERVGVRVREARADRSLSRRALAERSGVSERYLATLETGVGNVSIGVLERVAEALQIGIERLVAAQDPLAGETDRLVALYRRATAVQRRQALAALEPEPEERPERDARVCLIGLRGAGKSTLGPLVAADLNIPFVELADVIERLSGLPVAEVLALYGQAGYREAERRALQAVAEAHDRVVLAVAGGIVESPETYAYLLSRFNTVWLTASSEEHLRRVRRPVARANGAREDAPPTAAFNELEALLRRRRALYAQADAEVDTTGKTLDACRTEIVAAIAAMQVLDALIA